jgi:Ca-activated chloride channel family protein
VVAAKSGNSEIEVAADNHTPADAGVMDIPYPTRPAVPSGAPFSLGILVETSKTSGDSRRAVINSLIDMVRHLRDDDEAFLVFEEDLTSNSKALEKAMDNIKPQSGAALLDAMTFGAGHLQRIGKNRRKVLLIISDGEDQSTQYTPTEVVTELSASGVEIYCIGMGANTQLDESRLKAIARRTGGEAVFIDSAGQFRSATREVALDLGIPFH